MQRAVIYARYSTDLQNELSTEDQVRLCRERIERDGLVLVQVYKDSAISGATLLRPGIQNLLTDIEAGQCDVVYAEALDRLSRDQADIATIFKRCRYHRVAMVTLSEGIVTELHIGLKGTMNALQLKDIADKTRRGQRGRIEAGRSAGGKCYGYDLVREIAADGTFERGRRKINPEQADVIQHIFRHYATGKSPRAIAKGLNCAGIPGPIGKAWSPSTINGNPDRGTGILNNEAYIGRLVWNRLEYIKDPETGKRRSRPRSEGEVITVEIPDWRIVPQPLWDRVKERQIAIRSQYKVGQRRRPPREQRRPSYLLSGLMQCGCCGSNYTKSGKNRFACAQRKDRATCDNILTIRGDDVEAIILDGLKARLMEPKLFEVFAKEFLIEVNRQRGAISEKRDRLLDRLQKIDAQRARLVDIVLDGGDAMAFNERLKALETEKSEIEVELAAIPKNQPLVHPAMAEIYRQKVADLGSLLRDPDVAAEAFDIIRSLVDKIVLTPQAGELQIELHGDLAGILAVADGSTPQREAEQRALQIKMVAGAGFDRDLICLC